VGIPWLDAVCQVVIGVALLVLAWWLLFDKDRPRGWRKEDDRRPPSEERN
jgi:hypothetical protein